MIRHSKPFLTRKDFDFVKTLSSNRMLSSYEGVEKFEEKFSRLINKKYSVAVNSGTNALFLALYYLKEKGTFGNFVLIPSLTCVAVLNAVLMAGFKPIICDVNKKDFSYDLERAKNLISKYKIKIAVLPYMFGYPSDVVFEFKKMGVFLIEDIAQSLGAKINSKSLGSFGDFTVCSFYATKVITTLGEGGMISVNDKKSYRYFKDLVDYDKKEDFKLRFSFKMTEAQAFFGLKQLGYVEEFIEKRVNIARIYSEKLSKKRGISVFFEYDKKKSPIFYRYLIELIDYDKNTIIKKFRDFDIEASDIGKQVNFYYKNSDVFNVSDYICRNFVSVPIYPSLTEAEIDRILKSFDRIFV
ncbi:MAG: DegT/DnrJ/EryC1/StrS family aminotransferase [Elusimicrobiota bacterium]